MNLLRIASVAVMACFEDDGTHYEDGMRGTITVVAPKIEIRVLHEFDQGTTLPGLLIKAMSRREAPEIGLIPRARAGRKPYIKARSRREAPGIGSIPQAH